MADLNFKGFRLIDGTKDNFAPTTLENGYMYFIRTDSNSENGYIYFNGKKYGNGVHDLVVSITYSELKALRDSNSLSVGIWYRITDYETTVYNNENARAAGHPFDILVLATDVNKLSEDAKAVHSERDTDGYFAYANLGAWKLKYSLDNDTTKFAWAGEGNGVVWEMEDEFNNLCSYDFKNIQFKRWAIEDISSSKLTEESLSDLRSTYCYEQNGGKHFATKDVYGNWIPQENNGTSYVINEDNFDWYYTFHGLRSEDGKTISEGYDMSSHHFKLTDECIQYLEEDGSGSNLQDYCNENIIKSAYYEYYSDDEYYKGRRVLNNIVFINGLSYCYYNEEEGYWEYQTGSCYGNVFGVECKNNTFGNNCYGNTFGNNDWGNTFGNYCCSNTFGNGCYYNTFGNNDWGNTFGNNFQANTFGNNFQANTFGNNCYGNTFGNYCYSNTFGNYCCSNTFGNNDWGNTFGNYCYSNTFGNNDWGNTFGNDCYYNTFGNNFQANTFGNNCYGNTFGNYISYLTVFDGVQYVAVTGGSSSSYVQNAQILNGTRGVDESNKQQISFVAGANYTQIAGKNSTGELKIWAPADMVATA